MLVWRDVLDASDAELPIAFEVAAFKPFIDSLSAQAVGAGVGTDTEPVVTGLLSHCFMSHAAIKSALGHASGGPTGRPSIVSCTLNQSP